MRQSIKLTNRFGMSQMEAIERGKVNRLRLKQLVKNISLVKEGDRYPHLYFFSPPGLGKTYTVLNYLKDSKIRYIQVSGNVSMFAFGIQLAVINYLNPERENIVIFVDDCDEILKNEPNCNTMKNVLDGSKVFTYEKSLTSQFNNLSAIQQAAITHFQEEGKMGFSVPTDNLIFVFTSNFKLPVDDEVQLAREKGLAKSVLLSHRNAIRSRCRVADFDIGWAEQWGWIADVVLNTSCLAPYQLTSMETQIILDFLWYNWEFLTERSIRLVEKMANTMKEYPENFKLLWEIDYLKN
ncbi:hypothetical protein AQPE_1743 [Aquipluma nitroreducens]|uniref:ATPase AAA-type core domain-containing protein n=1 Tax=Aquipluma nitroreducens TaxID=2010828 RepID=A0A5K7S7W2_9BACT|nr:AAA family ATPase [Aquipluma nitroreducens]BBE17587.1 hypothetical protein AQPE_1743 [Aquipluma nitroreducens]